MRLYCVELVTLFKYFMYGTISILLSPYADLLRLSEDRDKPDPGLQRRFRPNGGFVQGGLFLEFVPDGGAGGQREGWQGQGEQDNRPASHQNFLVNFTNTRSSIRVAPSLSCSV